MAFRLPRVLHQLLVEPMFQGLVRKVGFPQQPCIDGVLVEEFLPDMGIVPRRDELQVGQFIDLALGQPRVGGKVFNVHYFFVVAEQSLDIGEQPHHVLFFFHGISFWVLPKVEERVRSKEIQGCF